MTARCAKPSAELSPPQHNERSRQKVGSSSTRQKSAPRGNSRQDKDKKKQSNYEQARSTRHAGRPADWLIPMFLRPCLWFCNESQNSAISWRATSLEIVARQKCCRSMDSCGAILSSWMLCTHLWGWTSPEIMLLRAESVEPKKLMLAGGKCQIQNKEEAIGDIPFPPASPAQGLSEVTLF